MKIYEDDGFITVRHSDSDDANLEVDYTIGHNELVIETKDFSNLGAMVLVNKSDLSELIGALTKIHDRMP